MKKSKYIEIQLTDKQMKQLEPLYERAIGAFKSGNRGMILGQTGQREGSERTVTFGFIESEIAAQVIKVVNPEMYEWNLKRGLIPLGDTESSKGESTNETV